MYFTKTRKFILTVLVAVIAFTFVGVFYSEKVYAVTSADTITYPFATGDYSLANAPTLKGVDSQQTGDTWHWAEQVFDSATNLTEAKRLLKFLDNFQPIDPAEIPPTSILREFIGGSSFKY